jgi:predicted phage terminase large subunit-like protein
MIDLSTIDLNDPVTRRYIVEKGGLLGWCMVYLRHYFTVEPADFHYVLADVLEDPTEELVEIIGFRGCAKSTFASLGAPLYLALENKAQFILPVGDTTTQTKLTIANMRYELEENEWMVKDYGITFDKDNNWSSEKLQLANGALIMGRSRGQKMRGLRHRQYRPQVVIADDIEDLQWVQKKENRNKTEQWMNSEVIPAQQEDGSKLIVIGNLLHKDALMMRLKRSKKPDGTPLFTCLEFPLINAQKQVTWAGKYPNKEAIDKQKARVRSPIAWAREYLLKILAEEDQVIKEEQIHYYPNNLLDQRDDEGKPKYRVKDSAVATDLAISEKATADYTAMVSGYRITLDKDDRIAILPNPVNRRMGFEATLEEANRQNDVKPAGTKWFVEDVAYQKAAIQMMKRNGLAVYPMRPITDKKARLETVAPFIIDGTVMFPESGCEELIEQLVNFGTEEHDDLVDALVYLIMGMMKRRTFKNIERPDRI